MTIRKAAAVLLLATFAFGAFANDLILKFKVLDCNNKGVQGVTIILEGCVDSYHDNDGKEFTATTDINGDAVFAPNANPNNPKAFVQYCFGSATGYCRWTAIGANGGANGKVYDSVMKTLQNKTSTGTVDVTAREASGCRCIGTDPVTKLPEICNSPVYYDAELPGVTLTSDAAKPIVLREQNCPCPTPPPPPPAKCPSHCKFQVQVTKGFGDHKKEYTDTVRGICSGSLKLNDKCGEKPENACPRGYINSRQACQSGKDCGVCCVAQTSLCAVKQNSKCNKFAGQCMCREVKDDATCKTLPFPTFIKHYPKQCLSPKFDDHDSDDNIINNADSKTDLKDDKSSRRLQETFKSGSYTTDWTSQMVDGCQDHLCGAVAAKGSFTASCCAHYA